MERGRVKSCEISELDAELEAVEECTKGNCWDIDAQTVADEDPREFSAESDKLLEVKQLVDELVVLGRELQKLSPLGQSSELPQHCRRKILKLLSTEGLEELSDRNRQEARLRILGALGLCLKSTYSIVLMDEDILGEAELSMSEVEALYRPLETSAVLKVINFSGKGCQNLKPESEAVLADILLGAKTLEDVYDGDCLQPAVLSHVAKAVASSGRGLLRIRTLMLKYEGRVRGGSQGRINDNWAQSIATLIHEAPNLRSLIIRMGPFACEHGAKLIGRAVASHQALERLSVWVEDGSIETVAGDADLDVCESEGQGTSAHVSSPEQRRMSCVCHLLLGAFLELPRQTSICSLSVSYDHISTAQNRRKAALDLEVLSQVLQTANHLTRFHISGVEIFLGRVLLGFLRELQENGHLQALGLHETSRRVSGSLGALELGAESFGFDPDSFAMLVELLKSSSMRCLSDLELTFSGYAQSFDWFSFYTALSQNSTIKSLWVKGFVGYQQAERELLDWIQSSRVLQTLMLDSTREDDKINWRSLFRSLREDTCLGCLMVGTEALEDDAAYRELMATLQVNSTLQKVMFVGEWVSGSVVDEREPTVRAALKCRARQESYLAQLRRGLGQGQAQWQSPRCGRLFLCGSPLAGKTRLTRTMLKVVKGKSLKERFKEKFLRRTEGVEIHTLRNDDQMQLLVWDLAGQDIFHALQQFLFPRLSRASMFIFVFSPHEVGREKKRKSGLAKAFEEEFLQWLKFIASNSAITGFTIPQVMVVISHRDLYKSHEIDITWSRKIIATLIDDFKGVIYIHPDPHFVDGHESQHVRQIVDDVYTAFTQLFEEKLFRVPTACIHMSQLLVSWATQNPTDPVIKEETFFSLCGNVTELRPFSEKCHEDDNKQVLRAVGSYLHDVGTLLDMTAQQVKEEREKPNLIVVNPNWLTHVFLGHFISLGHGFQLRPEEELKLSTSVDGFFYESDFQDYLCKHILEPMKKQFLTLTRSTLLHLMENLDLLYIIETVDRDEHNDPRYFIPTLFQGKTQQNLQWHHQAFRRKTEEELSYLGVRLRCKDSKRTYLSPAFFSRFQVVIWRKVNKELQSNNPVIECKFNVISLLVDGIDILIEIDQDGNFIDVLLRSSKSRRAIWKYVEKYIVEEVRDFCASSKGCPGVELEMHIIRTECVKRLTPCKHRRNQSVSKEVLRRNLTTSIQKLDASSEEKDLYSHTWTGVPEAELEADCEEALELLPPVDVDEVYAWIKDKRQSLQVKVAILRDVNRKLESDREEENLGTRTVQTNNLLEKSKLGRSRSEQWDKPSHEAVIENINLLRIIQQDVRRIDEGVKKVLAEVQDLKHEIREMNCLQRKEADNLSQIYHKLDQLIGYSVSTIKWPRRPYFTHKDVSVFHRITAVVDIGKPLMLHFQCEERDGHHMILKQPGYSITVGRENREALRQISRSSVRVIWYLLKAGLHISTGMGDLVPELQTSYGNTTLLTSLPLASLLYRLQPQDGHSSKQNLNPWSPEEAWGYLQDFLEKNLNSRITEYFLLHQAQYFDRESTHAWLCQECLQKGVEGNKLKKL